MSRILVIDDEESICWGLKRLLSEEGHVVEVCASAEEGIDALARSRPDAILVDVRLPGMDGLEAIAEIRTHLGDVPIVVMTAFGTLDTAVRAVRQGAFEYVTKPFALDTITDLVRRALAATDARGQAADQREHEPRHAVLIGRSPGMQEAFKQIALVAATDTSVLVTGESGTGKELVARAIHAHSHRAEGPFVPIHVAALSPSVIESELFGHVRGAFTGASDGRQGLLELAHRGTVFFDEVGDIPLDVQVKLLRALEQREVTPVGDARPRPVDFRVVAATHRHLEREVAAGHFRADLYFRLAVFPIVLPPLRERPGDVELLAERFAAELAVDAAHAPRISADALADLRRRPWHGNVRELRNTIERAAIAARGREIRAEHLPPELSLVSTAAESSQEEVLRRAVADWAVKRLSDAPSQNDLYESFLREIEGPLFRAALDHCSSNRQAAAHLLGIHRATLRKRLREGEGRMKDEG